MQVVMCKNEHNLHSSLRLGRHVKEVKMDLKSSSERTKICILNAWKAVNWIAEKRGNNIVVCRLKAGISKSERASIAR
jgi:hypothetical protein